MATRSSTKAADDSQSLQEEPVQRELGPLKQVIGFRLRRIQNHLSHRLRDHPEFLGRRPGELSVLAIIDSNPGLSQIALATEVGLDKAMMVAILDDLESLGWVRRERAPTDRRRNLLYITQDGQAVMARWLVLARENERPVRETLSEAEFALLSELLDRIYNRCFNHDET